MYMEVFKDIADNPSISYKELKEKYFQRKVDEVLKKYHKALIIKENSDSQTFVLNDSGNKIVEIVKDFPGLHPFYCEVFVDSMLNPNLQREIEFVNCIGEDWGGNFLHPLRGDLRRAKMHNSIMYCYMAAQTNTFDWLGHSLFMGHYDLVCRELRCILENLFFYYKLDFDSMIETVESKYQKIQRKEKSRTLPYGKSIFEHSGYSKWKKYYNLYRDLCAYIHISSNISGKHSLTISRNGFGEVLDIGYDERLFKKCIDSWLKIVNLSGELMKSVFDKHEIEAAEFNPNFFQNFYFKEG